MQHEDFEWEKYEFNRFTVFFYGNNKNLAVYSAMNAEKMLRDMEQFFDYSIRNERVQFVVYSKLEHYRQSNVGIPETDESNIGGTTQIAGSKIFLYYNGDLGHLRQQLQRGISQMLIGQMLFGDNWREMIKNNALISFPHWYIDGLVQYSAQEWSVEKDDLLRDLVLRDKYCKFIRLEEAQTNLVGQSLWYYISETYGSNVIPNILYMARVSRNVESGFMFVLGISLKTLLNDAQLFYEFRYETDEDGAQEFGPVLSNKIRKRQSYAQPVLNENGTKLAYSSNILGKTKVWIWDLEKEKRKKVVRQGHKLERVNDESYPLLDWNPVTGELTTITEKRGKIWLSRYDERGRKQAKLELLRMEKVLSMDYSKDGKQIVFTGINKGQSDVYLYSVAANSQKQLTDDVYDDLDAAFWKPNTILFSSNRTNDTLNQSTNHLSNRVKDKKDIYLLDLSDEDRVMNMTNTLNSDERSPKRFDELRFSFLSDATGISNRYIGHLDSTILSIDTVITYRYYSQTEPITGYARALKDFDGNPELGSMVQLYQKDGKHRFEVLDKETMLDFYEAAKTSFVISNEPIEIDSSLFTSEDSNTIKLIRHSVFENAPPIQQDVTENNGEIDIYNYEFELDALEEVSQSQEPAADRVVTKDTTQKEDVKVFRLPEQRNYNLAFAATDLTTQFDFDYATELYQPFNGGPYVMPGLGTFFKVGMLDVFEDYKLEGGFRYSFNNSGTEFFISLEDRSKRLDKKYILQRQIINSDNGYSNVERTQLYQARSIFRYAIDEVNALQATVTGRYDRTVFLAANDALLSKDDNTFFWGGIKLEYIFDNTLDVALNILNGARTKVFAEHYRGLAAPSVSLNVVGLDSRHYQKIHRNIIWANRLAASSSFGPSKLVYYMGSVDNWIALGNQERFDNSTNVSQEEGYQFQTIATNMRGFVQNARNGNNFAVINSELRWPIVKYFANKPLKSEFLSSFQLIGFGDIGSAWNGVNPYSSKNTFNTYTVSNQSVTVIYQNQNDPIIGSLGFGARAKIWGYFVRFDYAWGIENGVFLDPMYHLSFGLDF